jgi:hypothetical protein
MGLIDSILRGHSLKFKTASVPFHFEIHKDEYLLSVESVLDKAVVWDLFFKGVKKLRKKAVIGEVDELPVSFSANPQQLKALENVVINKSFLENVSKQVQKDVPSFKIINSKLDSLQWNALGTDKYTQKIVIKGICYYEE